MRILTGFPIPFLTPRSSLPVLLVAALLLAPGPPGGGGARAATWFADAAQADDSGDGRSWLTARRHIDSVLTASAAGDTILVKYGSYPVGDALVLSSDRRLGSDDGTHTTWDTARPDSAQCLIVADATCRVLTITGAAVTSATCVRGFTLTGGDATLEGDPNYGYGGGLDINGGADPVVERCRMTANLAGHTFDGFGGGLSVRGAGSTPEIRYCRIDNNTGSSAWYAYGGGVYLGSSSAAVMHDCVIVGNRASTARVGAGGGVAIYSGSAQVLSCDISGNVGTTQSGGVGGNGGGVYTYASTATIRYCTITDNVATEASGGSGSGGGLCLNGAGAIQVLDNPAIARNVASTRGPGNGGGIWSGSGKTIQGNVITDNTACSSSSASAGNRYGVGGGVTITDSNTNFRNNLLRGNTASLHGEGRAGGLYFESTNTIERNILQGNVASGSTPGYGGGAYTGGGTNSSFRNNTLLGNANVLSVGATGAGSGYYQGTSGTPHIENNIICDHTVAGSDGVGLYAAGALTIGYNCLSHNAGGNYNGTVTSQFEQAADPRLVDPALGDFGLRYDSPCIEAGNPASAVPANGAWRVDIGAVEYTGTRHLRDISGAGEYLFGGRVKAKVNVVDPGTLARLDLFVFPGERHPLAPGSVRRYYTIDATGTVGLFDLTLSYLDEELDGALEDSLACWRRVGFTWEGPKRAAVRDKTANWLRVEGQTSCSDWVMAEHLDVSAAPETPGPPAPSFTLAANEPNPFSLRTRIAYRLPAPAHVRLALYDAAGRLVRLLVDDARAAGEHALTWDGRAADGADLPAGVYFCELRAGGERQVRKLLLAR